MPDKTVIGWDFNNRKHAEREEFTLAAGKYFNPVLI